MYPSKAAKHSKLVTQGAKKKFYFPLHNLCSVSTYIFDKTTSPKIPHKKEVGVAVAADNIGRVAQSRHSTY